MKKILKENFPMWLNENLSDDYIPSAFYAKIDKDGVTVYNEHNDIIYMGPKMVKVKDIKQGCMFRFTFAGPVWVRDCYIRECKKYSVHPYEDVNKEKLIKGDKLVYTY
jgi:hypothetical protein